MTTTHIPSHNRVEPGSINTPATKFPETSPPTPTLNANDIASDVIHHLNTALYQKDYSAVANLFLEDGFWRDHLCISWDFRTVRGREKIATFIRDSPLSLSRVDIDRSTALRAPHIGPVDAFGDATGIEFFTKVETGLGRGVGVARLIEREGQWKIFTFFTSLRELKGHEEGLRHRRPKGVEHGERQDSKNWKDKRIADVDYEEKEPSVVIVGMASLILSADLWLGPENANANAP